MALNWPKQHNKLFFAKKKSRGRSPSQELVVGPRSGPYHLVFSKGLNVLVFMCQNLIFEKLKKYKENIVDILL